jgi:phosphotransferase system enzyme I (PtsP)
MLKALRNIVQEVSTVAAIDQALDLIVRRVRATMGVAVCSIYLVDQARDRLVFMATDGLRPEGVGRLSLSRDQGLVGLVAQRAEPVNLQDATLHPRFHYVPEIGEEPFHAFMGVPIIHHRDVLGVLVVQQVEQRRFDDDEEAFLITLSAQLAGVIAHARATGALRQLGAGGVVDARFRGVPGAPGVAIGVAVLLSPFADLDAVPDYPCDDVAAELELFERAVAGVRTDITELRDKMVSLPAQERALFDAYLHMLDAPAIPAEVVALIRAGQWAQGALRRVIQEHVYEFDRMEDDYLRERAADVRELGQRVLAYLQDVQQEERVYPERTVLVAREVTPGMIALVPAARLAGIVSLSGSGHSHASILARSLGIPCVMGCSELPLVEVDEGDIVVDGFYGDVYLRPSRQLRQHYEALQAEERQFSDELFELRDLPAQTPDGHRIALWVNVGLTGDISRALQLGAEGVGLYRTEIPFMTNERFPTEEEQRAIYREHMAAFSPRPVTMRTLDIGGDKPLSYFPIREENPFLGWRGIRVTLDHPEIFIAQVRAMVKASAGLDANLRIMLPMVTNLHEVDEAVLLVRRCFEEVRDEGFTVRMPQVGCMVEVPAAVYLTQAIAERCDFVAVGSNDLTQYLLAVDRNNARVAQIYQELHPAVLAALRHVVAGTRAAGKPVGICGELAGSPLGAVLLVAMGFDTLSMNATNLLKVKWVLRHTPLERARQMLERVLTMSSAEAVRKFMRDSLVAAGLGRAVGPEPI